MADAERLFGRTASGCCGPSLQLAMPVSMANLASKSEKDLAGMKRSKSAVRLEDEETVVVDVTRLHRKEVSQHTTHTLFVRCTPVTLLCLFVKKFLHWRSFLWMHPAPSLCVSLHLHSLHLVDSSTHHRSTQSCAVRCWMRPLRRRSRTMRSC